MSVTVSLCGNALDYRQGGGHLWAYLNWALGLRSLGCRVIWLEVAERARPAAETRAAALALRGRLRRHGIAELALCSPSGAPLPHGATGACLDLDDAASASDLLLSLRYGLGPRVVGRFPRSALVDLDPGLLQLWLARGQVALAPHDVYFTTGEAVGRAGSRIPDAGIAWEHAPPCVALDHWPLTAAPPDAPFTTVSHWGTDHEWVAGPAGYYSNDKRDGFLPFLDLPRRTGQPLELALCLARGQRGERRRLERRGWRVRHAARVAGTPSAYRRYIQRSRGELSAAKPSCTRLENGWISDRTVCYLASGRPAVVQWTGPSSLLEQGQGVFRFRDLEGAARALATVAADYERQCRLARALAEERFDARAVATRVLERALAPGRRAAA